MYVPSEIQFSNISVLYINCVFFCFFVVVVNFVYELPAHVRKDMIQNPQLVIDKKVELDTLRQQKIKGQMVRARVNWLKEGKKSTKSFLQFRKKKFLWKK